MDEPKTPETFNERTLRHPDPDDKKTKATEEPNLYHGDYEVNKGSPLLFKPQEPTQDLTEEERIRINDKIAKCMLLAKGEGDAPLLEACEELYSLVAQMLALSREEGRRETIEEVWTALITSLPSYAENLSTLTDDQMTRLMPVFLAKLTKISDRKEQL